MWNQLLLVALLLEDIAWHMVSVQKLLASSAGSPPRPSLLPFYLRLLYFCKILSTLLSQYFTRFLKIVRFFTRQTSIENNYNEQSCFFHSALQIISFYHVWIRFFLKEKFKHYSKAVFSCEPISNPMPFYRFTDVATFLVLLFSVSLQTFILYPWTICNSFTCNKTLYKWCHTKNITLIISFLIQHYIFEIYSCINM